MDEEALANIVLVMGTSLERHDYEIVRQLWHDRQYLLGRCKIIAEALESEGKDRNPVDEIASWARKAYNECIEFEPKFRSSLVDASIQ